MTGRASQPPAQSASGWSRLVVLALCAFLAVASGRPVAADGWQPGLGQRLDLQLIAPFDLGRRADALVLELFTTDAERVAQLRDQGTAAVCRIAAGLWEGWRPDAASFPAATLGRSPGRSPAQRLVDVRAAAPRPDSGAAARPVPRPRVQRGAVHRC